MRVYVVGAEKKRHCCVGIQGVSKLEQPQHLFEGKEVKAFSCQGGVQLQIIPACGLETLLMENNEK